MTTWVPGIEHIDIQESGGSFLTAKRRAVWHTTEGTSISGAIASTRGHYHLYWNPNDGRIVQAIPLDRAATSLKNLPGGVQTNRWGAIQVGVIGYATRPFTDGPMKGREKILEILRNEGIPDVWPAGAPLPYPQSYGFSNPQRNVALWLGVPGHYGHSQVPENDHGDPGAIDITKLMAGPPAAVQKVPVTTGGVSVVLNAKAATIPLAHRGFGLFEGHYDAGVRVHGCQATILGPNPATDGWWEFSLEATVRCQVRGTKVVVTALCPRWKEGLPAPSAHVLAFV